MKNIRNLNKEEQRRIFRSLRPLCDLDRIIFYMLDGVWKYCKDDEELIATIKELWNDDIKDSIELFEYVNSNSDKFIKTIYCEDEDDNIPWAYLLWPDNATKDPNLPSKEEYKKMIHDLENQGYDLESSILLLLDNQKESMNI